MAKYRLVTILSAAKLSTLSITLCILSAISAKHVKEHRRPSGIRFKADSLSCRDQAGKPIDWTLSYKLPQLEHHQNNLINSGFGSIFVTKSKNNQWSLSAESMNSTKSIVGATVSQLWDKKLDLLIAYNDQPPVGEASSKTAHAKGVLAISANTGFWLIHSVPKFPDLDSKKYYYSNNGRTNGQNLLCVSLSASDSLTLNVIAGHLLTMRPDVYKAQIDKTFAKKFPLFVNVEKKKWTKQKASNVETIYSAQKTQFTAFVKNRKFNKDIYSDLIAPYMKHDIAVQSWRSGAGGKLPTDCFDKFKVMNIDEIRYNGKSDWKYTEDHSKWAVSTTDSDNVWCIADLNRMHSQFKRGGGAICLRSAAIRKRYRNITQDIEACPIF